MAGNTTNPYLTKKAQEKKRLSIPVVAVCTIFGLGAASAGIDLFREGKTLSGVMAVLLLATPGGPQLTERLTLFAVLGYVLLIVAVVLALRVLVIIFRPD